MRALIPSIKIKGAKREIAKAAGQGNSTHMATIVATTARSQVPAVRATNGASASGDAEVTTLGLCSSCEVIYRLITGMNGISLARRRRRGSGPGKLSSKSRSPATS